MHQKHRTYAQQICIKKAGLIMQKTNMLWPGCRIGIAVSGGVDSFVLLETLRIRQTIVPFKFEIMALHCNPGFDPQNHASLLPWMANAHIPGHIEITNYGPLAHSPENKKSSPCFLCAWLRRKRLFELCRQYKLTHLAFGHNANDLACTFLLNILRNGRVQGMAMKEYFFNGNLILIRPLLLVEKKYIRQAAKQWDLPVWKNTCPSSGKSSRQEMEDMLAKINMDLPGASKSLTNGVGRWELQQVISKIQYPRK